MNYEKKYQRDGFSINGSIAGNEDKKMTSQREVFSGKDAFSSPYINMNRRGSNTGAYVTPSRQRDVTSGLYASGGEVLVSS